jgi:hypothetical protein
MCRLRSLTKLNGAVALVVMFLDHALLTGSNSDVGSEQGSKLPNLK